MIRLPQCARQMSSGDRCNGTLLPLSDTAGRASLPFKAWACSNENCGFNLAVDNGRIGYGEKVGKRKPKADPDLRR